MHEKKDQTKENKNVDVNFAIPILELIMHG
jgi:hypothetical protein